MANHKATLKDMRKSAKRNAQNRYYGKTMRNAVRDLLSMTDFAQAKEQLPKVESMVDKLAKRKQIHANKAANLKRRIAKSVHRLSVATSA